MMYLKGHIIFKSIFSKDSFGYPSICKGKLHSKYKTVSVRILKKILQSRDSILIALLQKRGWGEMGYVCITYFESFYLVHVK